MLLQNAPQNDENFEDAFRDDRDKLELEWHANWFRYPYWTKLFIFTSQSLALIWSLKKKKNLYKYKF